MLGLTVWTTRVAHGGVHSLQKLAIPYWMWRTASHGRLDIERTAVQLPATLAREYRFASPHTVRIQTDDEHLE